MAFGLATVFAGALQTTSARPDDASACPAGTDLVAEFEWADHDGEFRFVGPDGNDAAVAIADGGPTGGEWESRLGVVRVIVIADGAAAITTFHPAQTEGSFSSAGIGSFNAANASHRGPTNDDDDDDDDDEVTIDRVRFCGLDANASTGTGPGGNQDCPAGLTLLAKFNWESGSYVFEKPAGNEGVVSITNADATGGAWSSAQLVGAIVVKGGNGSYVATVDPASTSGTFTQVGLPTVGSGNTPDISNLKFCGTGTTTTQPATTVVSTTTQPATTEPATTVAPTTTEPATTVAPATTEPATTVAPATTEPATTVAPATTEPATTVAPTTTEPATTVAPTTTQPATTQPATTAATTTSPGVSTTSPTTAPPVATTSGAPTSGAQTTTTSTIAPSGTVAVVTSTTIVVLGEVIDNPSGDAGGDQLPRTGSGSGTLVLIGVGLLGAGVVLAALGWRRDRVVNP